MGAVKTMKIPKKLFIGPHVYKIAIVQKLNVYDTDCNGATHNDETSLIEILADLTKNRTKTAETFLHETIHAIADVYDIRLDEHTTDQLAVGLLDTIRRNKLDFLFEDDR